MKFVIGTVEYFNSKGFDTKEWRKSVDGIKAIAHEAFIKTLIPDMESDVNLQLLVCPSSELSDLLNSEDWAEKEVV
jgi:hypothetical protein